VNHRLKRLIAVFFVVQIVLPFTAPLHVCDLNDLFGSPAGHHEPGPNQNNPFTPTPAKETEAETDVFVSPLAASALSASVALVTEPGTANRAWIAAISSSSSSHVQQTVLRL